MKKLMFLVMLLFMVAVLSFAKVTDFVPANASMVGVIENNTQNYDALKEAGIFGFLLRDMGLEGMLTQQFESMKYADPDFDPENIWGLLKGDMAFFTVGEIDFESLYQMQNSLPLENGSAMDMMDPTAAMIPLMNAFKDVSFCLVLEPTVNPDDSLKTIGKLMGTALEYGPTPYGVTIEKVGNTLLIGMGTDAITAAKAAKSNPITSDPNFMEAYSTKNWMTFYSSLGMDTAAILKSTYPDMPVEMFDKVNIKYGWTKVYVDSALVFDSFMKYDYKDENYRNMMIASNTDMNALYQRKLPGFLKGSMGISNFKNLMNYVKPMIEYAISAAEKETALTSEMKDYVWKLLDSVNGSGDMAMDLSMNDNGEMVLDMLISGSMDNTSLIKELIEKEKGSLVNKGDYSYILIPTDDGTDSVESLSIGDMYLILFKDKVVLTTIKPENYTSVLSSSPSYAGNSVFKNLTDKFSLKKGLGVLYVDFSKLLTSFLGMAYPSGLLAESGIDNNGNSKTIVVLK